MTQVKVLVNSDKIIDIYVDDGDVIAELSERVCPEIVLGKYEDSKIAENVVEKIAQSYGAISLFRMPSKEELKSDNKERNIEVKLREVEYSEKPMREVLATGYFYRIIILYFKFGNASNSLR